MSAPTTVTGDPGDGFPPASVVDYARLSPVQQIALGLRGAAPQGPNALRSRPPAPMPRPVEEPEVTPAGAD